MHNVTPIQGHSQRMWEPPVIQPHHPGGLNKFGHRTGSSNLMERIDGVSIDNLMDRYGSPLFITSERRLRQNVQRIRAALEGVYPTVVHGWSYKTNYTSAVCRILHQEGSWAEVVSRFEYEKARLLGVPGERILFNGPNKSRAILERAVAEGAHLHVDHLDELALIEAIAGQRGQAAPVTLRLNMNTGYTEAWSRFGFNLENGQADEAAARVAASPHLRLTGLHSHLGTFILDPRAYGEQTRRMCAFMQQLEADGLTRIEWLDIGGGLPSRNALQGIYAPPEQAVPPLEDYADAIGQALADGLAGRPGPPPTLVFESGRAVVDDAQVLAASVVGTKRLPDGRRAAVLDAGINLMLTALWYNHPVRLVTPKPGLPEETALFGPMCMNIDVMRSTVSLPPLAPGDRLVFAPVGAYNNTQWLQFIEYRPPVVLVHADGNHSVIREGEDLDSMCQHDRMPAHLERPANTPQLAVVG
ncbi:alanine racemase [Thiorhodovibrio frisius]|uniref:Diaminopimelate decarboxylase n=1 Tax=Thiorhodovibrio frisius TaxID=631362 RepID=H8Z7U1_9GAMM|nr:alanine racemase [Thiorhodovibrio frisius]EIC20953.1 diaminopimelate decarboxylase [Thiorhodovibrio frisius]WPL22012.1 Diaminopimelate decarboxylase [Thiorhodovibrio frisius]